MSKILNCNDDGDCRPWRAPALDISEDVVFDYKLTDPEYLTHREQQQKIRQQAYEKSYAKGYMEGLTQGQREMGEQISYINAIIASLSMPMSNIDGMVVDEMVQLSMAIAKQLIRRELKMSPDEVVSVVKEALNVLPLSAVDITLELHPADADLIRKTLLDNESHCDWRIVENPVLTRGGCRATSSTSRVDATVEKRLNEVIAQVMGDERTPE